MTYFTRKSHSGSPGGQDGDTEVIYGQERPWLMENRMVALCKDARLAEHIAALLRRYPFTPNDKVTFGRMVPKKLLGERR